MPVIHCHLPITVRVHGTPSDAQLGELAAGVRRVVMQRITEAEREVAQHLDNVVDASSSPPSATARRVRSRPGPEEAHIPGRGWRVLRSVTIQLPLGEFLDFWQEQVGRPVEARPLYADYEREPAQVTVWLVQTETSTTMVQLAATVAGRVRDLMRLPAERTVLYLSHPSDRLRRGLAVLDDSGRLDRIPPLRERNARRVSGTGSETELLRGAWLLWAGSVLPSIDPRSWVETGPLTRRTMSLEQAASCVDPAVFEERFSIPFLEYLEVNRAVEVRVDLVPSRVRVASQPQSVVFLAELAYRQQADEPAQDRALLHVVFDVADAATPLLVAQHGRAWARALPPLEESTDPAREPHSFDPAAMRVAAGTIVSLVAVHLPMDTETLAAVRFRPNAVALAGTLREWITRDLSDLSTAFGFISWLSRTFGSPPYSRPPGGTLFEHVLAQLSEQERTALFDAVRDARRESLERALMLHCVPTRFADAPEVRALLQRLLGLSASRMRHTFYGGESDGVIGIDLDQDPRRGVRVGGRDVLGDAMGLYITTSERTSLEPDVHQRLRDTLVDVRIEVMGEIASGEIDEAITEDDFLRICMERAVPRAGVSESDFVTLDIERSIRILGVTRRDIQQMPSWDVRFVFVERVEGTSEWSDVSVVITETSGEFTARLIFWALGRAGEVYAWMGLGIMAVGGILIAWEAGIIAALIALGGGAKVVGASIAISVLVYLAQVVFTDKELSAQGFLMAAVEGYLGAVGFRGAVFIAQPLVRTIGTATVRRVWTGIVVEKLMLGVVGGGTGAGLTLFAQDLVRVVTGRGFSTPEQYLQTVSLGAAIGVLGEFTLAPILTRLGGAGASTTDRLASLYTQLRAEGYRFSDLLAETAAGLSRLRGSLSRFLDDEAANGYYVAFRTRSEEMLSVWATSTVSRRVLELSGAQFSRQAQDGLRLFLEAAEQHGDQEAARRLTTVFARSPQETVHLLEVLATLETRYARSLMTGTFTRPEELAQLLAGLSRYTPEQQRGVLRMLGELSHDAGLRAAPPGQGLSQAALLEQQASAAMAIQARGLRADAARLRRQAEDQLDQALASPEGSRRQESLLDAAAAKETEAVQLERLSAELSAGRDPRPGAHAIDDLRSMTDAQIGSLVDDMFDQLQAGPWIRLPAQRGLTPPESDALTRLMFTSRSGNPVVFRVEGGHGTSRSREYIRIGREGDVRIDTGNADLNVNVGSFERAIEFMIAHRPGSTLKMFEVEGAWLRNLRGAAVPEQGMPARLQETLSTGEVVPLPQSSRLADVRGTARTVDTRQAADQLQIDDSLLRELEEFIIPGTGREIRFTATGRTGRPQ